MPLLLRLVRPFWAPLIKQPTGSVDERGRDTAPDLWLGCLNRSDAYQPWRWLAGWPFGNHVKLQETALPGGG